MTNPIPFEGEIHALMNCGAGRARIQVIQQAAEKLKALLEKTVVGQVEVEAGRIFAEFVGLAEGWKKEAQRLQQLEQPALEDAARRAAMSIAAPRSPLVKLSRAWRAALAELR